ncbi:MAG: hypothetical protein KJ952_03630 [Candidatus Omnitrophica bacterium]|nr:hypothetical protein [Candidatus Omnitrophota bacterium]
MKVSGHAVISLTVGGILYYYSHSLAGFLGLLLTGIFVDLDHYIDYVREQGISFDYMKIYSTCKDGDKHFKKLTLILHSYELVIFLWLAIVFFNLNIMWQYITVGLTLHLVVDQITNRVVPLAYFFSYRVAKNFETKKIFIDR